MTSSWLTPWWKSGQKEESEFSKLGVGGTVSRVVPEEQSREDDGEESLDVWGFQDTQFRAGMEPHRRHTF